MAGGKETPRQKMIGMMYLVLTALLALNVSKEILQSFVVINNSLEITNDNFVGNNANTYAQFEKANANDPLKAGKYYKSAKSVKALADELVNHIEELKGRVVAGTDGLDYDNLPEGGDSLTLLQNANSKDNYDTPTTILIGSEPGSPKEGENTAMELKEKIEFFEQSLLGELGKHDPKLAESINLGLELRPVPQPGGRDETWINGNFYHLPLAAVITNMSKIQTDIRNAEAQVIKALLGNISADDFKFDTLAAKVIPNTNYLILGDTFKADVFVAAFSTTQDPKMIVGTEFDTSGAVTGGFDSSGVTVNRGVATYRSSPKGEGLVEWGGVISIMKPDGSFADYPFKSEFMVAKPTLVVSPTAMNVFYRGLDNPVEISVPGVPTEQLNVSISNGSKSGAKGKFKIRPGKGKECSVSVTAEINGQNRNFGKQLFRVKNVPDPKPYFAGSTGSANVQKKKILAAQGVIAKMENFEFDLKFNVISFVMSATVKGKIAEIKSRGPRVTGDMKTLLGAMKPGQKLYLEKIKAKGPDGTVRDLGTIVLKII